MRALPRHEEADTSIYDLLELVPGQSDDRPFELFLDGRSLNRTHSLGSLVDLIVSDITREGVDAATGYAVVHASAAVLRDRAVVLPAPPEHGKTTTIAALVRAGWNFLTDEAALISLDDGLVHPFPRPLMVSPRSMAVLGGLKDGLPAPYEAFRHFDHHVAPDDLRPHCLSGPARARFIVFPSYGEGSPTLLTAISRAEAAIELLQGCFNLPVVGHVGLVALAEVVRGAECYRLSIGAIEPAVRLIQGLVENAGEEAATA
jgi:hypothetical protein